MRGVVWGEGVYVMDGRGFGGMVCMFVNSLCSLYIYRHTSVCVVSCMERTRGSVWLDDLHVVESRLSCIGDWSCLCMDVHK